MLHFGKAISKYRKIVLLIGFLLLIPSAIGMALTPVNYDLLSYLPESLDTIRGQNIMVDEYGIGAFSMVVVENMELKDVQKLEKKFEQVDHVKSVLWYDDVADLNLPVSMIPKRFREAFFNGDATLMIALFDDTTSSKSSMEAVTEMRKIATKQCFISGMSGVVNDIKDIALKELPAYVVIAAILSLIVLELTMDSVLIPVFFLVSIGMAILYNLGTNYFLGSVSYVTKALTAVLQLGVTMDYSIFLLDSYEEDKEEYSDPEEAMSHAIAKTFTSILGSSVTTVAGFAALCFMTFALGRDLGIVMAKGVLIGLLVCVTILPSLILVFDRPIERFSHKPVISGGQRLSAFIVRHHKLWIVAFLILLVPAIYGNTHVESYYNIASSLPDYLPGNVATKKLEEDFDMASVHMIMMDKGIDDVSKRKMLKDIEDVKGVKWCIGKSTFVGANVPDSMIPKRILEVFQSDEKEIAFVGSEYHQATPEVNQQIGKINKITASYGDGILVIGEGPMMKDLEDTTNVDIRNVNIASILAIFVIIMIVFRSVSLPAILVAIIEFAICLNMAIPYYMGTKLPFVASIVIGTIQLGATVDYAIVMTTRYVRERLAGKDKKEAVALSHSANEISIFTSAMCLFAATFGVSLYSSADMIGSICTLLARGCLMSMFIVQTLLPALLLLFDKLICKTTMGMGHIDY
ncbi:MAG: MMPL family transporter [Eubacterium sp.]|nr:MMPL family transporter [Eubacterium sp.]